MPDISMCTWKDCPLGDTCYRLQAVPSYIQAYADFETEFNKETNTCIHHIKYYKGMNRKILE